MTNFRLLVIVSNYQSLAWLHIDAFAVRLVFIVHLALVIAAVLLYAAPLSESAELFLRPKLHRQSKIDDA